MEVDGQGSRPSGEEDRLEGHSRPGHVEAQLGGLWASRIRPLPARAHEPGLLHLRAFRRRVRLLRRHRQALRPDPRGRASAPTLPESGGSSARSSITARPRTTCSRRCSCTAEAMPMRRTSRRRTCSSCRGSRGTVWSPSTRPMAPSSPTIRCYVLTAPWMNADARAAAEKFRRWLAPKITTQNAARIFRMRRPAGLAELEPPEPDVLAAIQDAWHEDRKPANIVVVMDTSLSMGRGRPLGGRPAGVALVPRGFHQRTGFARHLRRRDRDQRPARRGRRPGAGDLRCDRRALPGWRRARVPGSHPGARTLRALDDRERINAVVVLSDGAGTSEGREELLPEDRGGAGHGRHRRSHLHRRLRGRRATPRRSRRSPRGPWPVLLGGPKDINDVYRRILSYF